MKAEMTFVYEIFIRQQFWQTFRELDFMSGILKRYCASTIL